MSRCPIVALVITALLAIAPPVGAECHPPPANKRLRVSLKPDSSLADVARWLSAMTCKPVVYGAGVDPAARVTIVAEGEIRASAIYGLFVDALAAIDLRAIRGKESIIIKPTKACAAFARRGRPSPPRPYRSRRIAPPDVDEQALERGIRRQSATEYVVRRSLLDKVLANSHWIMRSVRIVPHLSEGRTDGFKLYAIRPGAFWYRVGLKNGDTVHEINGMRLHSPEKALEVYTAIRGKKTITLRITRRGKPLTLRYRIR